MLTLNAVFDMSRNKCAWFVLHRYYTQNLKGTGADYPYPS